MTDTTTPRDFSRAIWADIAEIVESHGGQLLRGPLVADLTDLDTTEDTTAEETTGEETNEYRRCGAAYPFKPGHRCAHIGSHDGEHCAYVFRISQPETWTE